MHINNSLLVILEEYSGLLITTIGSKAFADCSDVKSIVISENISNIADSAFLLKRGCIFHKNMLKY